MRSRYSSRLVLAAAAACVLAVTATGCSGSDGSKAKVASATQGNSSSASAAKKGEPDSEVARYVESQRKVAACLRKEGVDVPDPDAQGEIDTSSLGNWKQDPAALKAMMKCQPLGLPRPESIAKSLEPTRSAEEIAQDRRFAECMQENGVPDYPDPDFDEKGWPKERKGSEVPLDETTASYKRALPLCYEEAYGQKYVPAGEAKG
ncbi:hypothetical protein ACIHFC_28585 [Streptomyces sp. NPDC052013]|uniref:hypothetical protein n=1 Tax=Streptomyces sp. NPDC052013 TaxID=3365679 RepID=UPI0037D04544